MTTRRAQRILVLSRVLVVFEMAGGYARGDMKLLDLILGSAGEGIYGLDCEGLATFVNPAAARLVGYSTDELIGQSMHAMLHQKRPDGSAYPAEECPIYAAFKDGKVHRVESEVFWRRDGTSFPVEYTSTPIIKRDIRISFFCFLRYFCI